MQTHNSAQPEGSKGRLGRASSFPAPRGDGPVLSGHRALPGLQEVKQTSACLGLFSVAGRELVGMEIDSPNPV